MSTLTIDRISARVPESDDAGERCEQLLRRAIGDHLESEVSRSALPRGHVCIARLDVTLHMAHGFDTQVADEWARLLVDAVARAAMNGSEPNVVRFAHDLDVVSDVVTCIARGRYERLWAWQQAGACSPGDPAPMASPSDAVMAVLHRFPQLVAPSLIRSISSAGVPALVRLLDEASWSEVLALLGVPAHELDRLLNQRAAETATVMAAGSPIAELALASRLRFAPQAARGLAALIVAESQPALLAHSSGAMVVADIASMLGASTPAPPARSVERASAVRDDARPHSAANDLRQLRDKRGSSKDDIEDDDALGPGASDPALSDVAHPSSTPAITSRPPAEAIDDADGATAWTTSWAGLPFLLAVASDIDVPMSILDHSVLGGRPLAWTLRHVAAALVPTTTGDPGVLAFSGRVTTPSPAEHPATAAEEESIARLADDWARACRARLVASSSDAAADGIPLEPRAAVARAARRDGLVEASPGWIEVVLDASMADPLVRRAGLDLDPGWVPWLGTVLEFRYV